ncbi:MAG TPA: nucleoside triphosphate pyrophosphohydrolase [Thermoanaerobaculia bacterium]|nr:nucleoside triphosphate pyrophosphohydrolase [Thermoanaerobaculia bacterium]
MEKKSFQDLTNLMTRLRAPGGCPWDREQTLQSLKPFVIEEAYEVVDAIDRGDTAALVEEIGDFLLQAVFLSEIGRLEGSFDIDDCVTAIHDKLVRRHPHVFADVKADTAGAVLTNWEKMKSAERAEESKSLLSGLPVSLPALLKATRMTEKAARIGFDWNRTDEVFEKVEEEILELKEAITSGESRKIEDELGDLLFTVANLSRKLGVNAEESLQAANRKFQKRFEWMELTSRERSVAFDELNHEEMNALWNEAKSSTT